MTHSGSVPGSFETNWTDCVVTNPNFKCKCGSQNIEKREWESSCGGYTDYKYRCKDCNNTWWVEGPDA